MNITIKNIIHRKGVNMDNRNRKSRPHNLRLVGTYNKEDDLYYFILQKWNKDNQEYQIVQNITAERFELNKR
tara:strand:- start:84 stop:299 length:216 start_codon:yes stop_codon:yes gene_type:complete